MKILLFEPPVVRDKASFDDVVNTPLASCLITGYVGAYLEEKGFEVTIISYPSMGSPEETHTMPDASIFHFFDIIGVHLVYQWDNTGKTLEAVRCIKEANSKAHVTVYGYYPTFTYKSLLEEHPFIDSVIVGEPEEPFARLVSFLSGLDKSLPAICQVGSPYISASACIPGVAYRDKSGIKFKAPTPVDDINSLPFPLRDNSGAEGDVFYVLGSRGCFGRCSFCYIPQYHGKTSRWRGRSPENIIAEMKYLKEEFGATYFYFADANFFGPGLEGKKRVNEFAGLLKQEKMKVSFGFECMPSDVEEDVFKKLVSVGLKEVFLGIESGSERILRLFRRKQNKEENKNAIGIVRRLNISLSIGFIMFTPSSLIKDIRGNFEFLREMGLLSSPSNSAHLLSHKEFLFKGMADGEMISGGGEDESLLYNYEMAYKFKDDGVQMLYDAVYPACKLVLGLFKGEDLACAKGRVIKEDPISVYGISKERLLRYARNDVIARTPTLRRRTWQSISDKINCQLLGYFEDALRSVEKGDSGKNGLGERYRIFEQTIMRIKEC